MAYWLICRCLERREGDPEGLRNRHQAYFPMQVITRTIPTSRGSNHTLEVQEGPGRSRCRREPDHPTITSSRVTTKEVKVPAILLHPMIPVERGRVMDTTAKAEQGHGPDHPEDPDDEDSDESDSGGDGCGLAPTQSKPYQEPT